MPCADDGLPALSAMPPRSVRCSEYGRLGERLSRVSAMLEFVLIATDTVVRPCQNDLQVGIVQSRCVAGVGALGGKIVNWWAWGGASSRSPHLMPGSKKSMPRPCRPHRVDVRPEVSRVSAGEPVTAGPATDDQPDVTAVIPIVRRIIYSRVANRTMAEDLVQETLVKVLGAAHRVEPGMLEPYAIVTARNVVASMWKEQDRHRRNVHRVVDLVPAAAPDEDLLKQEERDAVSTALNRLSERERQTLLAHEVSGQDTRSLGAELGLTAGAVAAAAEPSARSVAGRVSAGPAGRRTADRSVSSGVVRPVGG